VLNCTRVYSEIGIFDDVTPTQRCHTNLWSKCYKL